MSKIDEMIKKFCPNGVEYKPLISFTKVLRGRRLTKNQLSLNAPFPVFHGGLEPLGFYSEANRPANSVMIINVGASAGTVGFCDKAFWSSDGCFTLESSENNSRYLYYAILCQEGFLKSRVRKAGIPTLDSCVVEKLIIPVPPLEIQEEIVHILDKFTELTAELTARKKQYEFYRDMMLTFKTDVDSIPLGDLFEFKNGLSKGKEFLGEELTL